MSDPTRPPELDEFVALLRSVTPDAGTLDQARAGLLGSGGAAGAAGGLGATARFGWLMLALFVAGRAAPRSAARGLANGRARGRLDARCRHARAAEHERSPPRSLSAAHRSPKASPAAQRRRAETQPSVERDGPSESPTDPPRGVAEESAATVAGVPSPYARRATARAWPIAIGGARVGRDWLDGGGHSAPARTSRSSAPTGSSCRPWVRERSSSVRPRRALPAASAPSRATARRPNEADSPPSAALGGGAARLRSGALRRGGDWLPARGRGDQRRRAAGHREGGVLPRQVPLPPAPLSRVRRRVRRGDAARPRAPLLPRQPPLAGLAGRAPARAERRDRVRRPLRPERARRARRRGRRASTTTTCSTCSVARATASVAWTRPWRSSTPSRTVRAGLWTRASSPA